MKKQFRKELVTLKALYTAFRESEGFYSDESALDAYNAYWTRLQAMCNAYGKSPRQIAGAMNI